MLKSFHTWERASLAIGMWRKLQTSNNLQSGLLCIDFGEFAGSTIKMRRFLFIYYNFYSTMVKIIWRLTTTRTKHKIHLIFNVFFFFFFLGSKTWKRYYYRFNISVQYFKMITIVSSNVMCSISSYNLLHVALLLCRW